MSADSVKKKILVVDDSPTDAEMLAEWLGEWDFTVLTAGTGAAAREIFSSEKVAAVILDYELPDTNGVELFRALKVAKDDVPMFLVTGHHRPELTIEAMREGLYHYMSKPIDMEEFEIRLRRALATAEMKSEYTAIASITGSEWFVGKSAGMMEVFRQIGILADKSAPVLIYGETGTGKELVARALHNHSSRTKRNFITLNLAGLSPHLIESELFGHEKGAFTDAIRQYIGRFEAVADGTLFIDEMASIPMHIQEKLLRVLEYGDFQRVGGDEQLHSEARLVVATNRDPKQLVTDKKLREDLYYRLNVATINIPPLRERADDIPRLVEFFIARENADQKRDIIGVSNDVLGQWEKYHWPGNVRQLQNTIRRAVLMTRDSIISETFIDDQPIAQTTLVDSTDSISSIYSPDIDSDIISGTGSLPDLKKIVADMEEKIIRQALEETEGNLSRAAQLIGLTRREIQSRIDRYGIDK